MVNGNQKLHDGWEMARIADIGADGKYAIVDGPFGSMLKVSDYIEGGTIPVISISNIDKGFAPQQLRYISEEKFQQIKRSAVTAGDILVAKIGSSYGKVGYYPNTMPVGIIPANLLKITVSKKINKPYVYYYLQSSGFKKLLDGITKSTAQPAFNVSAFRELPIPLPSLPEQERIVAKIEELFTQLEAGTSALERVQAGLRRYKASVLKAAVEGKLGMQNEEGRMGEGELPEGWRWTTVSEIGDENEQTVLTGPFGSNLGSEDFQESGVPVLTIGCLTEKGLNLDKAKYVSSKKAKELERYKVREGDFLFSRMATVGRGGLVTKQFEGLIFNYHLMRLRLDKNKIDINYFLAYVRGSRMVTNYVRDVNHGATRDGINTKQLLDLPISLPPLEEQRRIVAEVERRLSVARQVEATVEEALVRAARLRQSVLKHAFEGKL